MLCKSGNYEAEGWLGPEELNRKPKCVARIDSSYTAFSPCQMPTAAVDLGEIEHKGSLIEFHSARPSQEIDDCRAAE
jgi:hypothetical protein